MALTGVRGYPHGMGFDVGNQYLETAAFVMLAVVLGAAIFFWGRGIRRGRKGDLLAGPAILLALCIVLMALSGSSGVFATLGTLILVFGVATVLLSAMARPGGMFLRRNVIAIGVGAILAGACLMLIL
ncbi:MAG TPA: hypothetical protein PK082_00485 [Phycisphaerae bacterium]|nr:hypothetical protein [Phycisphaerae bacterium]